MGMSWQGGVVREFIAGVSSIGSGDMGEYSTDVPIFGMDTDFLLMWLVTTWAE